MQLWSHVTKETHLSIRFCETFLRALLSLVMPDATRSALNLKHASFPYGNRSNGGRIAWERSRVKRWVRPFPSRDLGS